MSDAAARALDPVLLEVLACPACHGGLELTDDRDALLCAQCRVSYPIQDGVPVLLTDEARPLDGPDDDASEHGGGTDDART